MKKILYFLYLYLFAFISCNQEGKIFNGSSDVERQVYDDMINQGLLKNEHFTQLITNINHSKSKLDISKTYSYDSYLNLTTTKISISSKKSVVNNVSVIEYIPKEVVESIYEINFITPRSKVINKDSKIMWHLVCAGYFIDNGDGRVFYDSDRVSEYKNSLKTLELSTRI